jgi:hypothetical protein
MTADIFITSSIYGENLSKSTKVTKLKHRCKLNSLLLVALSYSKQTFAFSIPGKIESDRD